MSEEEKNPKDAPNKSFGEARQEFIESKKNAGNQEPEPTVPEM